MNSLANDNTWWSDYKKKQQDLQEKTNIWEIELESRIIENTIPAGEIIKFLEKNNVDFMVMERRGEKESKKFWIMRPKNVITI